MKRILIGNFLLILLLPGIAQARLNAYFSYALFDNPATSPYVETYLNIAGSSLQLIRNDHGNYQGTLEVQWIIRQGNKIVHFDKYKLYGPELENASGPVKDFIDQQRFQLDSGKYELELNISDKNSSDPAFKLHQDFNLNFPTNQISVSDIELIESYVPVSTSGNFSKSGYDLAPFVTGFYPDAINSLKFYAEIYRAKSVLKENFLVRYFISNSNNRQVLSAYVATKKMVPEEVNVVLAEIPIDHLPSGNYNLTLEVINRENKLIKYSQIFFQRSKQSDPGLQSASIHPENLKVKPEDISSMDVNNTFASTINNPDSLKEFIACLYPISSEFMIQFAENQIKIGDVRSMQQYLYYFWSRKDPVNPEGAWSTYRSEVNKTNVSFGTRNRKGYETDRGRVYLQYGPPNSISEDHVDPNAYPYEIWHYYKLDNQSNRKFVFYSNDLSANDYKLLHSDAKGELQEPGWELKLHSRSQQFGNDLDQEKSIDIYGSKTKELFQNPH